jgi:hypothetical protein
LLISVQNSCLFDGDKVAVAQVNDAGEVLAEPPAQQADVNFAAPAADHQQGISQARVRGGPDVIVRPRLGHREGGVGGVTAWLAVVEASPNRLRHAVRTVLMLAKTGSMSRSLSMVATGSASPSQISEARTVFDQAAKLCSFGGGFGRPA